MTTSAPSARQRDTGSGFTTPPSTSHRSWYHVGVNSPGSPLDARTALITGPSRIQISSPV
jgi:hypothetical protein